MKRIRTKLSQEMETRILSRIVDAMLAVQDELEDADDGQWSRILVDACRQEKRSGGAPCRLSATARPPWTPRRGRICWAPAAIR
jgi:hypothetical protein